MRVALCCKTSKQRCISWRNSARELRLRAQSGTLKRNFGGGS